jgi:hypothetical protein
LPTTFKNLINPLVRLGQRFFIVFHAKVHPSNISPDAPVNSSANHDLAYDPN